MKKVLFITREDAFNNNIIIPFIKKNFEATIICENRTKSIPKMQVHDWSGDYIELSMSMDHTNVDYKKSRNSYNKPSQAHQNIQVQVVIILLFIMEKKSMVLHAIFYEKVDTGQIISVKTFPLLEHDNVEV